MGTKDGLKDRKATLKDVNYDRKMSVRTFADKTLIFEPHQEPIRVPAKEFRKVLDILTEHMEKEN